MLVLQSQVIDLKITRKCEALYFIDRNERNILGSEIRCLTVHECFLSLFQLCQEYYEILNRKELLFVITTHTNIKMIFIKRTGMIICISHLSYILMDNNFRFCLILTHLASDLLSIYTSYYPDRHTRNYDFLKLMKYFRIDFKSQKLTVRQKEYLVESNLWAMVINQFWSLLIDQQFLKTLAMSFVFARVLFVQFICFIFVRGIFLLIVIVVCVLIISIYL